MAGRSEQVEQLAGPLAGAVELIETNGKFGDLREPLTGQQIRQASGHSLGPGETGLPLLRSA